MAGGIKTGKEVPNPGSDEALALGCLCPVLDNHHGAGMPYPDGPRFWISGTCPVHMMEVSE